MEPPLDIWNKREIIVDGGKGRGAETVGGLRLAAHFGKAISDACMN